MLAWHADDKGIKQYQNYMKIFLSSMACYRHLISCQCRQCTPRRHKRHVGHRLGPHEDVREPRQDYNEVNTHSHLLCSVADSPNKGFLLCSQMTPSFIMDSSENIQDLDIPASIWFELRKGVVVEGC